ncbi:hypothetical protein GBAR_LOCUS25099, partial [Geodia barretti]
MVGGGPSWEMVFTNLCRGPGQPSLLLFLGLPTCRDPRKWLHVYFRTVFCVHTY